MIGSHEIGEGVVVQEREVLMASRPLQKRAYQILEKTQPGDTLSRIFDLSILSLITLNIAALMLETIPAVRRAALKELTEQISRTGVTILSRNSVPEMEGVTHLRLDYLDVEHLRDARVRLGTCSVCVVFAESTDTGENLRMVDMHTVSAVDRQNDD